MFRGLAQRASAARTALSSAFKGRRSSATTLKPHSDIYTSMADDSRVDYSCVRPFGTDAKVSARTNRLEAREPTTGASLWENPKYLNVKDGWYDPTDPDGRLQSMLISSMPDHLAPRYGPRYVRPCADPQRHTDAMRSQYLAATNDSDTETLDDPDVRPKWDPKKSYAENHQIQLDWMVAADSKDPYHKTWREIKTSIYQSRTGQATGDTHGIHPLFPLPGSEPAVTTPTPLRPRFFGPSGISTRPAGPVISRPMGSASGLTESGYTTIRDDPAWQSTRNSYVPRSLPGAAMHSAREAIRHAAQKVSHTGAPTSELASLFQQTATLNNAYTGPGTYRSKRKTLHQSLMSAWADEQYRADNTTGDGHDLHTSAAASLLHATNMVFSQREHATGPSAYTATTRTFPYIQADADWREARSNYVYRPTPGSMNTVRSHIERAATLSRDTGTATTDLANLYKSTGIWDRIQPTSESFEQRRGRLYNSFLDCRADSQYLARMTTGSERAAHMTSANHLEDATNIFLSQAQ